MNPLLLIPLLTSFLVSFLAIPKWIKRAKKEGLVGKDIHKYRKKEVAESGGIIVIFGFLLGLLIYVSLKTFYFSSQANLIKILATTTSLLILSFVGLMDDILGWKTGLNRKTRLFLVFFSAIPLMAINVGESYITLPLLNRINVGLIYPLIFIPLGIVATSTTFNFIAGYNGLESGQGIILLSALSLVSYFTGSSWLSIVGLCMVLSLAGFWIFNKFPSRVFPGDVLTYPVGGLVAIMAILGNFERVAVFFFIPYILEVFFKSRGRLRKQSFSKPNKNGSLSLRYKKFYGVEHVAIWLLNKYNRKATEKRVVYLIHFFQILIIIIGFIIFRKGIF